MRYTPDVRLTFGDRTFDGPWRMENWIVTRDPKGSRIWAGVFHEPWWPAYLVAVDPTGQPTVTFLHPGHIYSLAEARSDNRSFLVGAGINNEYASAMLAVLEQNGAPAAPPSSDPQFTCRDCPLGRPWRYLLFERSELNRLSGQAYNRAYDVEVSSSGLEISVQEAQTAQMRALYHLSSAFVPESVGFSDTYWEAHRQFERDGKLDHAAEACPVRRDGMKVRVWEPERGWSEHVVPVSGGS